MTESERPGEGNPGSRQAPRTAVEARAGGRRPADGAGPKALAASGWIQRHRVTVIGVLLIAADLIWRGILLSHMYFRQDDFENLNLALKSRLNWQYLSYIGPGHFMMGQRVLAWLMTRGQIYDWSLATAIMLGLFAFTALAGLRLLRTLFGEHPANLLLLALFLLSPLTIPSSGFWSSATDELPIELAIFMAVNAHVLYVRRGRTLHLVAAASWVAFGLLFYEKGLVLPLLLFAITAAFFAPRQPFLATLWRTLVKYRWAWVCYSVLLALYTVLLATSLHTATPGPQSPHSWNAVLTFGWGELRNNLIPGTLGGPWQWLPISGGTYAIAAPPSGLTWVAIVVAIGFIGASVVLRKIAWRAWAIWLGWVAGADMAPIILRRINDVSPALYSLDTRLAVDAMAVLIICLGLAFLPLVPEHRVSVPELRVTGLLLTETKPDRELVWRRLVIGVLVAFMLGSVLSTRSYYSHASGKMVARFISNAEQAIQLVPKGTVAVNATVPGVVAVGSASPMLDSTIIGDIAPGRLRWITTPSGNIDNLRIFGPDGRLYIASVQGGSSPLAKPCFPVRRGQIVVNFWTASPGYSQVLRIGYLWGSKSAGSVDVQYGASSHTMTLRPGLHAGYLAVTGSANGIVLSNVSGNNLCVGQADAGNIVPDYKAPALPGA